MLAKKDNLGYYRGNKATRGTTLFPRTFEVSDCCESAVEINVSPDFLFDCVDKMKVATCYYRCTKCGQSCNVFLKKREKTMNLCECGCGNPSPISKNNNKKYGWIKGQPKRFIFGHAGKSKRIRGYIKETKIGNNNPMWKGDDVSYGGLHAYLRRNLIKPIHCNSCKQSNKIELCNKSGKYLRDINDWGWLCRRCHMKSDGRLESLIKRNKNIRNPIL